MSAADSVFLALALELAEQGRFTCAPNPPVGCVIVRDGAVLGRGYHVRAGEGHAEVNAVADAGGDVTGATVYVSLEPCAFEGRTPACAQMLIDAQVKRVVVATIDPHARVSGAGMHMLARAGVQTEIIDQPAARALIAGFALRESRGWPLVRIKTASSLDGATGLASGESKWITGPEAREDVQYWRARSDAIITGIETVLADDPQLNVRAPEYAHANPPLRVVLDSTLRTPPTSKLVSDRGRTLLVHDPDAAVPAALATADQVELLAPDGGPRNLPAVLSHLAQAGCNEVLVEAGGAVCGAFAEAGLWDEWLCYVAPKWLGSDSRALAQFAVNELAVAPQGRIIDVQRTGADVRIHIEATDER